jgi:hypothetical protein
MSQTKVSMTIDTDCHELIPNVPLAELIQSNLKRLPPPKFTPEENAFAQRLQAPLAEQFGKAVQNEFSKVRNGWRASNGAGFSHIRPTPKTVNSAGAC